MSVSGISSSYFLDTNPQSVQSRMQQFRKEFQQLGQDLQTGNLTAAQADFATLQQLAPDSSASSTQSTNPIAQDFAQLAKDLQSGNLSAAQQDYGQMLKDMQNQAVQVRHHHRGDGNAAQQIGQEFDQLGQALQTGDLAAARQAYSTLQQQLQQFAEGSALLSTQSASDGSGLSVTA